ncbi:hypothetical protein BU17DRAFT_76861 [Hysterangium stoloniferum]|nr:hypothetical protein BU17DRAFT_76861 [Hysterangium stoloniferum]
MTTVGSRSQRAPSPSNTTYSGISNYRTDSYRPLGKPPAVPPIDTRKVAKTHFDEIQAYLGEHGKGTASAREKLTRLTKQQFSELSTDVYDELMRRNNNKTGNEVPFLPLRQDFHPKRNQARQKLATLPKPRFKDLAGDVYFELNRRYPEFKEPELIEAPLSTASAYDDVPSPEYRDARSPQSAGFPSSTQSRRKPSREQNSAFPPTPVDRRRPSEDTLRSPDRPTPSARRPSGDDATSNSTFGAAATATSGMVIPNKSTIAEEEIRVPYGEEDDSRNSRLILEEKDDEPFEDLDAEDGVSADFKSPLSSSGGFGGLSALSAIGNRQVDPSRESDDDHRTGRSDSDYYERTLGRPSSSSDRQGRTGIVKTRQSNGIDEEKLRRDYELRITAMQKRINGLETDVTESNARKAGSEEQVRQLTNELELLRKRSAESSAAMLALQRELDTVRGTLTTENETRRRKDEEEILQLREKCNQLEKERDFSCSSEHDTQVVDQLRADLESLVIEVAELSNRNEELMAARDTDNNLIRELNNQQKEYKRKYEQAKTELRSIKATSQLYHTAPKVGNEDQLPIASSGGLLDIHVTSFLSSIDLLLTAGRSATPTRVYAPMKAVINAVHSILEDVEKFEARPRRDRMDVEAEDLAALRERAEMTLSNLVAAAKTHGSSLGMSPVSLLDAAASHVSSSITEIGKTIHVRKASKAEQDLFSVPTSPTMGPYVGRPVDEGNLAHMRNVNSTNSRVDDYHSPTRTSKPRELSPPRNTSVRPLATTRRPPSEPSSSSASSPPAVFDTALNGRGPGGTGSDDSALTENPDDGWAELKPYLETQSESIKYAIQSVLSAVRSPAPSPHLNESLTQIITIVSSIVAVCKDSLPSNSVSQGRDILHELSDHCNKLSEIQAMPEVTKESRQAMAKSSFAVANAMKSLVKM